ncbi:hypothetical protein CEQ90_14230 [Lewinellaceae bacterium SD302]|nr:hypothetical protein CEQ90_14230 [Lewinellaceae bacterium SD302]
MKTGMIYLLLMITFCSLQSQSCEELMQTVKNSGYGQTFNSNITSNAISKVTFYDVSVNYQTLYFAIVCFKKEYGFGCNEYLYQVAFNTRSQYSFSYMNSAGKAFWNYIHPHRDNLGCAPDIN